MLRADSHAMLNLLNVVRIFAVKCLTIAGKILEHALAPILATATRTPWVGKSTSTFRELPFTLLAIIALAILP